MKWEKRRENGRLNCCDLTGYKELLLVETPHNYEVFLANCNRTLTFSALQVWPLIGGGQHRLITVGPAKVANHQELT